ncbi:hypothetical protein ACS0TY_028042 [Phlomoides rotata]
MEFQKISEEVVDRIPNIKTLKVEYIRVAVIDQEEWFLNLCLNNFGLLQKLKSFKLRIGSLIFPHSLKKLNLRRTFLDWEELTINIEECHDLKCWETDSAHFPCIEHLILKFLDFEEIPVSIGDMPTLKSIQLESCNSSTADFARRLKEE